MTERWLPVLGYEGYYEVSSLGRVRGVDRSIRRTDGSVLPIPGRMKKLVVNRGYYYVHLCRDRGSRTFAVHRLETAAFFGPRPEGTEVCHNNGEPFDNRIENLRYDTHLANIADRDRHHVHHNAAKTHCPHGHEYTPENTYIDNLRRRHCVACDRARSRRRMAARRSQRGTLKSSAPRVA